MSFINNFQQFQFRWCPIFNTILTRLFYLVKKFFKTPAGFKKLQEKQVPGLNFIFYIETLH